MGKTGDSINPMSTGNANEPVQPNVAQGGQHGQNSQNNQVGQGNQNGQMGNNWQPQPQQMVPVQKQPMDPAKKKKLILGICLGAGGAVVLIIAVVVICILMKVDYGESYKLAKELKPKAYDISNNYSCANAVGYADSHYVDNSSYSGYVSGCLAMMDGVSELVADLGRTSGVKRNKEIKEQYGRFKEAVNAVVPEGNELAEKMKLYEAWHKFVVATDDLSASSSSDAEIRNAVKSLTESGNKILEDYGKGWLEKTLAYVQAYRAYDNSNAGYFSDEGKALRAERDNKQTEWKNWKAENKPDIKEVAELSFENRAAVYTEFTKLYEMIVDEYEKNYDGSGECTEFLGEVICS